MVYPLNRTLIEHSLPPKFERFASEKVRSGVAPKCQIRLVRLSRDRTAKNAHALTGETTANRWADGRIPFRVNL